MFFDTLLDYCFHMNENDVQITYILLETIN